MLKPVAGFSSFSISDKDAAKKFYSQTLGLKVESDDMGVHIHLPGGGKVFTYHKPDHKPASFTVLNLVVKDIDDCVAELKKHGVKFEAIDFGGGAKTDEQGIMRGKKAGMGPDIAWFKDPSGNTVAILED